ncbi:hypothetical protein KDM89_20655, partial [Undibacterium sp. LFS511W]|nr:hypothetical protein [Undibacterium luofuense]
MFSAVLKNALLSKRVKLRPVASIFLVSLVMLTGIHEVHAARRTKSDSTEPASGVSLPNPDLLLIETMRALSNNQLSLAQQKIDELVVAYPHFQLAHLIRGDLL